MRFHGRLVVPAVLLCLAPSLARAGEVRVDATTIGNNVFNPSGVAINPGDHVVWVWVTAGGHTCTSGSTPGVPGLVGPPNNRVQWATSPQGVGATFNFKFLAAGAYPYFCSPHSATMTGVVNVMGTHQAIADFRITEVRYGAGTDNFVEITNMGDAAGDFTGYRLDVNGSIVTTAGGIPIGGHFVNQGSLTLALGSSGYIALYAPNSVSNAFDSYQIVDFVEWGVAGQPREIDAVDAQPTPYWNSGDFLPSMADGHAIAFCGISGQYGLGFWSEVANPTPNASNDCASPAVRSTWGRLKSLYR